jgi:3-hydroxybutyryl-CoA dehydrogenase
MSDNDINLVGIVGAGTMGREIAFQVAVAGMQVIVFDSSNHQLAALPDLIRRRDDALVRRGEAGLTPDQIEQALDLISTTNKASGLAETDIISESVFEELSVKKAVWTELGEVCSDHTIFTTNTSSLAPSSFAEATGRPERFAAMHFHLPIELNRIVDVMTNGQTSKNTLDQVQAFVEKVNLIPIRIEKESAGYLFNAMLIGYMREAIKLLVNGIGSKEDIDQVWMSVNGVGAGPFASMDYVGIDTVWRVMQGFADREQEPDIVKSAAYLKAMVEEGKLGMKSGSGFYDY